MRQPMKSRDWQSIPLMTAGSPREAKMLARNAFAEEYNLIQRDVKPSGELLSRS